MAKQRKRTRKWSSKYFLKKRRETRDALRRRPRCGADAASDEKKQNKTKDVGVPRRRDAADCWRRWRATSILIDRSNVDWIESRNHTNQRFSLFHCLSTLQWIDCYRLSMEIDSKAIDSVVLRFHRNGNFLLFSYLTNMKRVSLSSICICRVLPSFTEFY